MLRARKLFALLGGAALIGVVADELRFRTSRAVARRIVVAGTRATYLERAPARGGSGTFVVVASPLVRARSYTPLVRALGERGARVVVVELPGSGTSARTPKPLGVQDHVAWLRRFLATMHLCEVTLIGHSNSGAVAAAVAAEDPRVSALILADSIGARPRGVLRVVAARVVDGLKEPLLNVRAFFHLATNLLLHARAFAAQVVLAGRSDLEAIARRVRVPTLVAWGRSDRTMPLDGAARLAGLIPNARTFVGPGSHDALVTRPRTFARAFASFAASRAARSR